MTAVSITLPVPLDLGSLALGGLGWGLCIVTVVGAIICWCAFAGYQVRIYRGSASAPDLAPWGELLTDGLKVTIVNFIWFLPAIIIGIATAVAVILFSAGSTLFPIGVLAILFLLLLLAIMIAIAVVYSPMGSVRFARTGCIIEGLRFGAISGHINTIGGWIYLGSLLMLLIAGIVMASVFGILESVPVGWITVIIISQLWMIFCARYISHLYDRGVKETITVESF
jgi:hypothetical protein